MMAEILSCYCGACTLTITGEPAMQVYCHCSDCRKWGGSIAQVPAAGPSARDGVPSP
ncbi:MAG: GFA family protein [Promethearchaeia archaeon]